MKSVRCFSHGKYNYSYFMHKLRYVVILVYIIEIKATETTDEYCVCTYLGQ